MSPFDIAVFAVPISFIIAILRGTSGMVSTAATDLAILTGAGHHRG
jgi:tRNA G26 N,N-dimethylase Trm1